MAFILSGLNLLYYLYLPILAIVCEGLICLPALLYWLARGAPFDAAARRQNQLFGCCMVRGAWPLLRVTLKGRGHVPRGRPLVVVANHRSYADIFVGALVPVVNPVIMVRSWPFRLPVLGWFMRLARYVDIERTPMEVVIERLAPRYLATGTSFVFFPEGHRSRDGRLHRFRSGAFRVAVRHGLTVLPICITGTEALKRCGWRLLAPARITVEVLPPIEPAAVPEENRIMKLKRLVEDRFREHLGEGLSDGSVGSDRSDL